MIFNDFPQLVLAANAKNESSSGGLLSPDLSMVILTWVTFFVLATVLYKFAWKPILEGLDSREESIRKSLEEAEEIRRRFEQLEESTAQMIAEAEQKVKNLLIKCRKDSQTAAKIIEQKAREEAQIILENSEREIKAQLSRTEAKLRKDNVEIVLAVASKLLEEKCDSAKSKKLVEKCIEEI